MLREISKISTSEPRSVVPCGSCHACCKQLVLLTVDDEPALYKTREVDGGVALLHKPDGSCFYLGDNGCTIWDRAPTLCKVFDCRKFMARFTRTERRQLKRRGVIDPEIEKAALERMHTLCLTT